MAEIYTKSVIKIGDETFRNLPAQVDRDQEVSYDANLKSQQAISTATDAKAKATEAKLAADAAQSTADAAQAKAIEAKTAADTAQSTADSATGLATQVQDELANALESKVVRYDETQLLSEDQMLTARGNIEAAPITGTVRYDINQSLTDEQKTKAKTNIGVKTDIDNINDTLENKVVRADKQQNLSDSYKLNARSNIDAQNSVESITATKAVIRQYAVLYREPFEGQTQTLADHQKLKVRTAISAPNDADVVKVTPQTLTDEQKAQARANIGAGTGGGGGSTEGAVLYSQAQNLTDEQKAQAKANIGITEQSIVIDNELSTTSENPVQNKAITAQINLINTNVANAQSTATSASEAAQQALDNASAAQSRAEVSVRYDQAQSINPIQQKQARNNIEAKYDSLGMIIASNIETLNQTKTYSIDTTLYKNLYIEVLPKSGAAYIGCTIPIRALSITETKRYQLTDETNYVSFNLMISSFSGTATLTYSMATRSQNTAKIVSIIAIP